MFYYDTFRHDFTTLKLCLARLNENFQTTFILMHMYLVLRSVVVHAEVTVIVNSVVYLNF